MRKQLVRIGCYCHLIPTDLRSVRIRNFRHDIPGRLADSRGGGEQRLSWLLTLRLCRSQKVGESASETTSSVEERFAAVSLLVQRGDHLNCG